jgi:type IV pilus assembly protein PilC
MSHFTYRAKKANGDVYKGERDANDRFELYKMLKESGEEVYEVKESGGSNIFNKGININIPFLGSVKTQEKINFAKNLGSMMSRALSVMERQTKNKELKRILSELQSSINSGKTLSQSMGQFPKVFSPLFVSMVSAGEQSGNLANSLKIVGDQMEKNFALQRRVRGAMMYPSIILFAMVLIAILMLTFIVPTLMKTFTELKVELPAPTRMVLFASDLIRNHGLIVLAVFLLMLVGIYYMSKKESGKKILHLVVLKLPVVGNLVKEVNSARTARTLSSLLTSGVDVVESVRITKDVMQNVYYKDVLEKAAGAIEKGEPVSKVFTSSTNLYPIFLGEMISVGEETGKMGEMLLGVATYYEEDVDQRTKDMSTVIEPFLMVIIGGVVGFFAIAMISPMYSLVNVI